MKKNILYVLKSLKVLIAYLICIIICLFYTLYVDGSSGVLLLSFMILIPIMSMIFMLIASKSVNINLKISNDTIKKNSLVVVTIEICKKYIFPIPFINLTLGYSPHINTLGSNDYLEESFPQLRFSMSFERLLTHKYDFQSKILGKGNIFIKDAYIYDYLGFFRIKLKNAHSITNVFITPEVRDIKSSQTMFNSICNNILTNDEEENSNDIINSIGSTLGYLHRDYVMGDSLRRINWKLSCKKNKLMVRLDEPSPQTKPCFIIDMSISNNNANQLTSLINFEYMIESSLALMNMCIKYGIECECILCNCEHFIKRVVTSIDDIYSLAVLISHTEQDGNHKLPQEVINLKNSNNMYIIFTDFYNEDLKLQINNLKKKSLGINIVLSPQYYGQVSSSNVWIVNKDLSIVPSGF